MELEGTVTNSGVVLDEGKTLPVDTRVCVVPPDSATTREAGRTWGELWGLGREVWHGVNVNAYIAELRADREAAPRCR